MTGLETLIAAGDIAAKRCIARAKAAVTVATAEALIAKAAAQRAAVAAAEATKAIEDIEVALAAIHSYCKGPLSVGRVGEPQ